MTGTRQPALTMPYPRCAIYFTPPPDSPLASFGASVLGYDSYQRADVAYPGIDGVPAKTLAKITKDPRQYGFHATLVAPFHLEGTEAELLSALSEFTDDNYPVDVGSLSVDVIASFIALKPETKIPKLDRLAGTLVRSFDKYRAAPTETDRVLRLTAHLSSRQREMFSRWGYPYVFDEFRFHMTLTGPLQAGELAPVKSALAKLYAQSADIHLEVDALSLMRQDKPDSRFFVVARKRFKK